MKSSSFFAVCALLLGIQAFAQTPTSTTNAGNGASAPATLHFKFKSPNGVDLGFLGDASSWIVNRLHTVNLDGIVKQMNAEGISAKNFVAGFDVEGAMVYQYEMRGDTLQSWNDIGRDHGQEALPFSVHVMEGGITRVSIGAYAFANMNTLQNSNHSEDAYNGRPMGLFRVVDQLDFVTLTWDNYYTFNNLRTLDVELVKASARLGIVSNEANTNYLALKAGGAFGLSNVQMSDDQAYGYTSSRWTGTRGVYKGGLEGNFQVNGKLRVNLQSNYVGGGTSGVPVKNNSIDVYNQQLIQNHDSAVSEYNSDLAQWNADKVAYEIANNGGVAISEAAYASASGSAKPSNPGKFDEKRKLGEEQKLNRSFGYWQNSIDVSYPLTVKSGRPMRLGVGVDVNLVIFDRLINTNKDEASDKISTATPWIDLSGQYNQVVRGRIYLKF